MWVFWAYSGVFVYLRVCADKFKDGVSASSLILFKVDPDHSNPDLH